MPPPEKFKFKRNDVPNKRRKYASRFQIEWLEIPKYKSWLQCVKEDYSVAGCSVCISRFDVSNMRITSIESHNMGQKHKKRISARNSSSTTLHHFFSRPKPAPITSPQSSGNENLVIINIYIE